MLTGRIKVKARGDQNDAALKFLPAGSIDANLKEELLRYNYKKIIQVVRGYGGRVRLFFQTYPAGPGSVDATVKYIAEKYNIKVIDQAALFPKATPGASWVANDGWHLNARGYNMMAKNVYAEFLNAGIANNKLTQDIRIEEREETGMVSRLNQNTWEYDLPKIARQPEKIVAPREAGLYFWKNSTVELPEIILAPGEYLLQIQAKGTAVDGVYPLVGFYYKPQGPGSPALERNEINKVYVNGRWNNYFSRKVRINGKQKVVFYVSFENDAMKRVGGQVSDRNLWINKITLNLVQ
jgi:hypothetical protein